MEIPYLPMERYVPPDCGRVFPELRQHSRLAPQSRGWSGQRGDRASFSVVTLRKYSGNQTLWDQIKPGVSTHGRMLQGPSAGARNAAFPLSDRQDVGFSPPLGVQFCIRRPFFTCVFFFVLFFFVLNSFLPLCCLTRVHLPCIDSVAPPIFRRHRRRPHPSKNPPRGNPSNVLRARPGSWKLLFSVGSLTSL